MDKVTELVLKQFGDKIDKLEARIQIIEMNLGLGKKEALNG